MQRLVRAKRQCVILQFCVVAFSASGCPGDRPGATDKPAIATSNPSSSAAVVPQATFGGGIFRNMVNIVDKNVPFDWSVEEDKFQNVKWAANIGKKTNTNPVVYGGRVFIGTNNDRPRDPSQKGQKAVLMCFAEKDGSLLWQNLHDMGKEEVIREAGPEGLCSTPTAEGDFVYYCAPSSELICAHAKDGTIVWRYDMLKELKVFPCFLCSCSPLIVGEMVFVVTGNGNNIEGEIVSPQAPSFVALSKANGKLVWHSNLPGNNIVQGQWANPVYAEVKGKPQVIFPGGDGWLYSFEPKTGDLIWRFNCSPKQAAEDRGVQPYFIATPIVHDNRCFIAVGGYPGLEDVPRLGHFFCIDVSKNGDVSCKNENYDPKDPANKESALVWHFGGLVKPPPEKGRKVLFGSSISTAAVHDGLAYVAESSGYLHCLDAKTGEHYWQHDFKTEILGSPYWVDGKILVCDKSGACNIFEHGKKYQRPRTIDMQESLEGTAVMANGVLFIATPTRLYAIGSK